MTASDYGARILSLLRARGPGKTICPSDLLDGEDKQNPALMERVRASARTLAAQGSIEFTQHGKAVDPAVVKGPIRLGLKL